MPVFITISRPAGRDGVCWHKDVWRSLASVVGICTVVGRFLAIQCTLTPFIVWVIPLTLEAYSKGDMPVAFLNCREKYWREV